MTKLLNLTGRPRALLLSAAGALAALALAPFFVWPLLPVSYGLWLHYLLKAPSPRAAFRLSWWWGFGFFLAGLYWICISMTVDLARFGWMIPFALIGMNGGLALFPALAGWAFKQLEARFRGNDVAGWIVFAALVTASEWLRSTILTGFPWNLIGYAWGANDASIQIAALLPMHALSFATILIASAAALWHRRWPVLMSAALFAALLGYSREQLKEAEPFAPNFSARMVQANIAQSLKNDPKQAQASFEKHIALSESSDADYLIWPESALPYALFTDEPFPKEAFAWLKDGQVLLAGSVVVDGAGRVFNSIVALSREAMIGRYDKQHLVPFGEYVPLRGILPIEKLTAGIGDFARGQGARNLLGRFHPLICYEAIFPHYSEDRHADPQAKQLARSFADSRPLQDDADRILLNLTNDGWFGKSSGPYQHLTMARFRAVEQRQPMIRAANTGISAVIDAYGRLQQSLPLGEAGVIEIGR